MRIVLALLLLLGGTLPVSASGVDDLKAGVAALQRNDVELARRLLSQAIGSGTLAPDQLAEAYWGRASARFRSEVQKSQEGKQPSYDSTLADADQAVRLKPDFADAYFLRGDTYFAKKDFRRSVPDYRKAIELKPDFARAHLYLGDAYFAMGQYAEAIAPYSKGIELEPQLPNGRLYRGDAYYALKQYDKALADYDEAIWLKPDYALAYANRARLYRTLGNGAKAGADEAAAARYRAK